MTTLEYGQDPATVTNPAYWDCGIPFISQRMVESPSDVVALLNEAECR